MILFVIFQRLIEALLLKYQVHFLPIIFVVLLQNHVLSLFYFKQLIRFSIKPSKKDKLHEIANNALIRTSSEVSLSSLYNMSGRILLAIKVF